MYLRCPACRFVAFQEDQEPAAPPPAPRCRRCGGTMSPVDIMQPTPRPAPRPQRVKEQDLDISEPAPQKVSLEEGIHASQWIRDVFKR